MIDVVEQPAMGWAIVLIDVQGSGSSGRPLAGTLMRMARECLAAGMSPPTTAAAVHEHLFAVRQGKVGASVHICAVNVFEGSAQVVGLGPLGLATGCDATWNVSWFRAPGAGFARAGQPQSVEISLVPGQVLVLANDGIAQRGDGLQSLLATACARRARIETARQILDEAIARDDERPRSDMAVAMLSYHHDASERRVLHASVSVPVYAVRRD